MTEIITAPNPALTSDMPVFSEADAPVPGVAGLPMSLIPAAMQEAAPANPALRQWYLLGALAATQRRVHPIVAPKPWNVEPPRRYSFLTDRPITVKHLPHIASPIVEMVRQEMPDLVMAADRGGRMLGLAVYRAWRQRYPDAPFPTIDGTLHFGRISSSSGRKVTGEIIGGMLHRSGVMAEMAQRQAEGDERPLTVMLLDDWVSWGRTTQLTRDVLENHGLIRHQNLRFLLGTMTSHPITEVHPDLVDRHVVGQPKRGVGASWNDDSDVIGVQYFTTKYHRDGYPEEIEHETVRSEEARAFRRELQRAVERDVEPSPHPYPLAQAKHPARRRKASLPLRFSVRRALRRLVNTAF